MSSSPFTSNLSLAAYPERIETPTNRFEQLVAGLIAKIRTRLNLHQTNFTKFYQRIKHHLKIWDALSLDEHKAQLTQLRYALVRDGLQDEHAARAFALVYQTVIRELKMRPYKVQLMGGWIMLNGMLAEMETGEGKTLTAGFPACTAALAGIPVHIITSNDYLAGRDAKLMQPLYEALGISVGIVTANSPPAARRKAYACDITYCTNKELTLDYLRDRLKQGLQNQPLRQQLQQQVRQEMAEEQKLLLRGLCYAIVDEADSVLIDNARTPLVLARQQSDDAAAISNYYQALAIAGLLDAKDDFEIQVTAQTIDLTDQGQQHLKELTANLTGGAKNQTEQLVFLALRAVHLLIKDKHYIVKDKQIQIIDENTGRTLPDRSWEKGLHQMIECKENCHVTPEKSTLARLTLQRFFRRYLHLAGMTGTARELAGELQQTYGLEVVSVPTRRPCRRKILPTRVFLNAATKWQVCVKRVQKIHNKGRPILIGTRTIADSEYLSRLFAKAQLPHQVLNARQDENEAEVIALAGKQGQITIATNMAGRGTDISLDRASKKAGGLHVISMDLNDARRLDRQLYGRCARQGDHGRCEAILSLEDTIMEQQLPGILLKKLTTSYEHQHYLPLWLGKFLVRWAQRSMERRHAYMRRILLNWDQQRDQMLAFSGKNE